MARLVHRRRLAPVLAALVVTCAASTAPSASAQEPLYVAVTATQPDHLWTGDPATISGRVTLADGQVAAGRVVTVEGRPYPYTGAFTEQAKLIVGTDGRFVYTARPVTNMQVRIRGDAGQVSQTVPLRVFHFALSGELQALRKGRQRATELSAVPPGYAISKTYLYFCRPKAKRCSYVAKGRARVSGQRMTARATFTAPRKYRGKRYKVVFRYVPRPGWGDSNAAERRKPKQSIAAGDQAS